jgi:hypothetical protein
MYHLLSCMPELKGKRKIMQIHSSLSYSVGNTPCRQRRKDYNRNNRDTNNLQIMNLTNRSNKAHDDHGCVIPKVPLI